MAKEIKRKMANYIEICCFLPYLMYMTDVKGIIGDRFIDPKE